MSDRKKPDPKKGQDHQPKENKEAPDNPVPLGPGPSLKPEPDKTAAPRDLPGG